MLDSSPFQMQRSRGRADVRLGPGGRVADLFQRGSAKAMLPRVHGPIPEIVYLNTSGGLTGGDRLDFSLQVASGQSAMAATQTAERAYASTGNAADVSVEIDVGEGATCLWLPQETILFDKSALRRVTTVRLKKDARFLGVETLVLGRAAMGETVETLDVSDRRYILDYDGHPIHAEHISLTSETLARRQNRAGLAGNTVFASLVYVADDAIDRVESVRRLLSQSGVASAWGRRLVVRIDGHDSWMVRHALIPILKLLGTGHVPRVWQC